jgi:hypothetical protein
VWAMTVAVRSSPQSGQGNRSTSIRPNHRSRKLLRHPGQLTTCWAQQRKRIARASASNGSRPIIQPTPDSPVAPFVKMYALPAAPIALVAECTIPKT